MTDPDEKLRYTPAEIEPEFVFSTLDLEFKNMKKEQYHAARGLMAKQQDLEKELELWEKQIKDASRLGYLSEYSTFTNRHFTDLKSRMSPGLFQCFRQSVINDLKLQLLALADAFEAL